MEPRNPSGTVAGEARRGGAGRRGRERDMDAEMDESTMMSELESQAELVRERAEMIGERIGEFVRENPGTAIAIAVVAGYLVGRLLRL